MSDSTAAHLADEADPPYRYQELVHFITALIERGALRPGMRAPSIRQIAAQRALSISTVLQAYRLLEDRGMLEARPKSGFYVTGRAAGSLETPRTLRPPARPSKVEVTSNVLRLLEYSTRRDLVPLGCAVPSADLLAAGRLDRFMARKARVHGGEYNTYMEVRGDPRLRHEICMRAMQSGQLITPDMVAITYGCTEALSIALRAMTGRGDTVAVESPTYFGLLQVLESLELKALELPTDANDGLDVDTLARTLRTKPVRVCLLSSGFSNPLGAAMTDDRKRAILALLKRHSVPLIEDDIYGDIYFGEGRPRPFMAVDPGADVTYCSSFSKTVAPGYRVGWVTSSLRMERMLQCKFATTLCGAPLGQAALAEFLSCGGYDSHLRRLRRVFAENISRMTREIERYFPAETRVTRPAGGFVLWLELPAPIDGRTLFESAIEAGITIAPGDLFSPSGSHRNCIRLSCGHAWDKRIEASIETLGRLATDMLRSAA
jgi:DNA-binding transcriptional MocR family regulator